MRKHSTPRFGSQGQIRSVGRRFISLLGTPFFWLITLWGNTYVLVGALVFHWAETGTNPAVRSYLDSLGWAVGIVTTVGGGIYPVTVVGKVLSILMMMGGALFLWSYMALFVGAFVDPELRRIEHEVSDLQRDFEIRIHGPSVVPGTDPANPSD